MYQNLGIHWASSIPAFLALACVPFPFLFYKYGKPIRLRCKYAAKAAKALADMRDNGNTIEEEEEEIEELDMIHEEERRAAGSNRSLGDEKDPKRKNADLGGETPVNEEVGRGYPKAG
jgi:hypothetical protein